MSSTNEDPDVYSSPITDRTSIDDLSIESYSDLKLKGNEPPGFDKWAPCKQQAWLALDVNPNAFFYRHVLPNETRRNGPWSDDEKELFIKMLKEHPPEQNGMRWGLFARYIPGRVGYQCNAFYKKLIIAGEVECPPGKQIIDPALEGEETKLEKLHKKAGITDELKKPKTLKYSRVVNFQGNAYAFQYPLEDYTNYEMDSKVLKDSREQFNEILKRELSEPDISNRFFHNANCYFHNLRE